MDRRNFLKTLGCGAVSLAVHGCIGPFANSPQSSTRPNILFIMCDDHASHAISCYGSKINRTPNIDRLAKEGMRFENCFCTNSVCAPSRAVILTGKYSHLNGIVENYIRFNGAQQTLPKLLKGGGYETAIIGKWHLGSDPTGFEYWNILPDQGVYHNPKFIEMGVTRQHTGYVTDLITDFCINWIKQRQSDKPFFLMYHHKAPHRDFSPDVSHVSMYKESEIPEPATFNDDYKTREQTAGATDLTVRDLLAESDVGEPIPENLTGDALKKWKYQHWIKRYLGCIASVDDNLGRMLDFLEAQGLAENTIVVYTSDQGFFLGDHGIIDKRFMYEESLRMPLIIRYPKEIAPSSVNNNIVLNLDFAPTLLDFAGVSIPGDTQGESFREILRGKKLKNWRKSMYYHYYEYPYGWGVKRHYGVRTSRYKLIHFYYDIDLWELYDLQKDPYELNNVCADPAYANIVNELKAELTRLRGYYGDSDALASKFINESLERARKRHQPKCAG
jgi:arylsulfatase A-like enzyme